MSYKFAATCKEQGHSNEINGWQHVNFLRRYLSCPEDEQKELRKTDEFQNAWGFYCEEDENYRLLLFSGLIDKIEQDAENWRNRETQD